MMKFPTLRMAGFILALCLVIIEANAQKASASANDLIQNSLQKGKSLSTRSALQYHINDDMNDEATGIRHIYAQQQVNGIYVKDALLGIHISEKNGMVSPDNQFVEPNVNSSAPSIPAEVAVRLVMNFINIPPAGDLTQTMQTDAPDKQMAFSKGSFAADDIKVRLMYVQNPITKILDLTWEVQYFTKDRQQYWVMYVDTNNGTILSKQDLVQHCSFGDSHATDASEIEQQVLKSEQDARNMKAASAMERAVEAKKKPAKTVIRELGVPENTNSFQKMLTNTNMGGLLNTYKVLAFPAEAPNDNTATNTQTLVTTDGVGLPAAKPFGWTNDGTAEYPYTRGNNVWSFQDPSPGPLGGAPSPDPTHSTKPTSPTGITPYVYNYPWDLSQEPEFFSTADPNNLYPNRNAATVNLFYANNMMHDIYYGFGFNEVGRNFQDSQNGAAVAGAGANKDGVLAQSQDGGGTNNANFLTLADGTPGQMQMYLWTAAIPDSLVQILTATGGTGAYGTPIKLASLQGALFNSANETNPAFNLDLKARPVVNKKYVIVDKNITAVGTASQGCGAGMGVGLTANNAAAISGNIVLIDRGTCSFVEKVDGAQKSGAAGVIVINNDLNNPDAYLAMGGSDATINSITIPSVMISYNAGLKIKNFIAAGGTIMGSLKRDSVKTPKRDGDIDNVIIGHEYGHGISTRTSPQTATGGSLSGSEQAGEGWSDFFGMYISMTNADLKPSSATPAHPNGVLVDRGIGTYVFYQPYSGAGANGIRPRKYSTDLAVNEYTFAGSTNGGKGIANSAEITVPHGVGFVWNSMLYEVMQNLVDLYPINNDPTICPNNFAEIATKNAGGNNIMNKLVVEGIRNQPASPTFLQERNGILKADTLLYNSAFSCAIWKGFAKRGLGVDAKDGSNNLGDETDGFAVPSACAPSQVFYQINKTATPSAPNGTSVAYTITVKNTSPTGTTGTNVTFSDVLPTNTIFDSYTVVRGTGITNYVSGQQINFTVPTLAANDSVVINLRVTVSTPTTSTLLNTYDFEAGTQGWTSSVGSGAGGVASVFSRKTAPGTTSGAHGGTGYWYVNDGTSGASATLTSPTLPIATNRQLRFWHSYVVDAGYDGGYLEYTTDGIQWVRVTTGVTENTYTGSLNATFNPVYAGLAWTGGSAYKESAYSIPDAATQVRFTFAVDAGGNEAGVDGWYIDDIRILKSPVFVNNTATVASPADVNGVARTSSSLAKTLVLPGLPNLSPVVSVLPSNLIGTQSIGVVVSVIEFNNNPTTAAVTAYIPKDSKYTLSFNPVATNVSGVAVQNSLWTFDGVSNSGFYILTTNSVIPASGLSKFGLTSTFNPNNQKGTTLVQVILLDNTGGESIDDSGDNQNQTLLIYTF